MFWMSAFLDLAPDLPRHPGPGVRRGVLQILLQRLGDDAGPVRAHLDLATSDRGAETARHKALGAEVLDVRESWTVLADPAGSPYCITGRTPETRVLDERPTL
jgi:hypothetical protein